MKNVKGHDTCNRTVCQVVLDEITGRWWNPSTQAYYCRSCAFEINKWNPGLLYEGWEK